MSCCSESKIRAGGRDRVSKLPDAVLYRIRSVLVPKDAVRTSTLSTRCMGLCSQSELRQLRFLLLYWLFRDFSQDFSHAHGWIRTAIRRKVAELDLLVESDDGEMLLLPFEPVVEKARLDEIEVAKYLLKNGEVLKKMTFHAPEFGLTKRSMNRITYFLPAIVQETIEGLNKQGKFT
ncbi:hypothetical protein ACFX13_031768 [Malus domestica]